jgi:CubicO group peptidase (beta-lactamase class C family)
MASKRFYHNFLRYLVFPIGFAVGLTLAIVWSAGKIKQSDRYIQRHLFPADKIFTDLDKAIMAKKGKTIDSAFTSVYQKGGFNGTVLYAEKGRLVFKEAYGYDDFRGKKRLTTESAFQLASVSKMFTAMAVMILEEEGMLQFDDSLPKYIPELPYQKLTLRHLLNHRSGLPDYMHFSDQYWGQERPMSNDDMIRVMVANNIQPMFPPNGSFDYCNTNYALLASVVERISKKPFEVFVQEKIFDPLDMGDSFIYRLKPGDTIGDHVPVGVAGHRGGRGLPRIEPNFYQNGVVGDKGVYASVEDLFKWDQALYTDVLVSQETLEEAFTGGSPKFKEWRDNYGFGWRIKADRTKTVYHYGWWKGFRTYFIRDIYQEKTIIVLTNWTRSLSSGLLYDILDDHRFELGPVCRFDPYPKKPKAK